MRTFSLALVLGLTNAIRNQISSQSADPCDDALDCIADAAWGIVGNVDELRYGYDYYDGYYDYDYCYDCDYYYSDDYCYDCYDDSYYSDDYCYNCDGTAYYDADTDTYWYGYGASYSGYYGDYIDPSYGTYKGTGDDGIEECSYYGVDGYYWNYNTGEWYDPYSGDYYNYNTGEYIDGEPTADYADYYCNYCY